MPTFRLKPKPPYDFDRMLNKYEHSRDLLFVTEHKTLIRTIRVGGNIYLTRITSTGEVDAPELEVEIDDDRGHDLGPALEHIRRMLSIDVEVSTYVEHLQRIPVLTPLAERYAGLRMVQEPDLFASLVHTIIGQQLNIAFAAVLTKRLFELAANPLERAGRLYPVFPSAEEIARLSYEDLCAVQYSRRKAEYVIDLARNVADGSLDLDGLKQLEDQEVLDRMIRYRGIGKWTVECFLLFGLGRQDVLPAADVGLRNAVKRWYGLDVQPTEPQVREIGVDWTPWSSYITYHMWESLKWEPEPVNGSGSDNGEKT